MPAAPALARQWGVAGQNGDVKPWTIISSMHAGKEALLPCTANLMVYVWLSILVTFCEKSAAPSMA